MEKDLTLEEANQKEEYYINFYNSRNDEYGYNTQKGGNNHEVTEEIKQKISKTKKEQHLKMSEEQKKKLSENNSGKNNPFYGKKHTEETKKKMSENHANVRGGNSPTAKKVMCIETGIIYPSAAEAAEFCNRTRSAINNCISGLSKTAGGYHWIRI